MEENKIEFADTVQETIPVEDNSPEQTPVVQEASEPVQASDPFDELMTEHVDAFTAEQSVEPVETVAEEGVVPKEDPNQHQYWQSQYDKVKSEFDNVNQKYQEMENLAPIARYIQENPGVLDNVQQSLSKSPQAGQAPPEPQPEPLKRPERPTKPAEYDAIDAYSDPNTASYKYRDSMDAYRDGMIEFQEERNNIMENAMVGEAERQRQIMMQQQQQQQMSSVKAQLTQGYEFSPDDADKFISEMAKPESITMDNLVALWKMKQAPPGQVLANQRKAEEMHRQKERLSIPSTLGVAPAETPSDVAVEDRVMDALIDDYKSQNPF
ncbi:MAG: hypothetical protein CMI54_00670 [Parcubacteria group bacterium]|jgi:hypothetical protein|nr:hypothetical protein [Parcubacteria group bacterium]|tara:strand:- start:3255 stop:4226 length:972 start_codon:yes stop_codon:yes gene_type:complete